MTLNEILQWLSKCSVDERKVAMRHLNNLELSTKEKVRVSNREFAEFKRKFNKRFK